MDVTIQEDSEKTGKVTSAGMYFLHFQVYRMDSTLNAVSQFLHFFIFVLASFFLGYIFCIFLWPKNWWFIHMPAVQIAIAKDPESAFFKRLEGLQPCEVSELKAGTHIFAVYGLNCKFYIFTFESYNRNG